MHLSSGGCHWLEGMSEWGGIQEGKCRILQLAAVLSVHKLCRRAKFTSLIAVGRDVTAAHAPWPNCDVGRPPSSGSL